MFALLASLFIAAAGGAAPATPPPILPDTEVVRYLKPIELTEWGSAKRGYDAGVARVQQGESILKLQRAPLAPGQIGETPEQAKARAEKVIADGKAQMAKAMPSLTRLRQVATSRQFDLTKTVTQTAEFPHSLWSYAITHSAIRLQKQARESGYHEAHLVGASLVTADNKFIRSKAISDSVRAAWIKVDPKSLAAVPADGYTYVAPANGEGAPQFAKAIKIPSAAGHVAMVWVELYQLDSVNALLFVRLADAYTFHIVGSEAYLTTVGPSETLPKACTSTLTLVDQRSFLPRMAASGDWVLSFERDDSPLGVALLRHLCVTSGHVDVGASVPIAAIIEGDAPVMDGARAAFRLTPEKSQGLTHSYRVSSTSAAAPVVEVGTLTLKIEPKVDAGK